MITLTTALAGAEAEAKWEALSEYLIKKFYDPDLEAIRVALAVGVSHYYLESAPIWLLVVGPPASAKTTLVLDSCLSVFRRVHFLDKLTSQTFLSGFSKNPEYSFLHRVGKDGILLFPDFTTFTSGRDENKREVAGDLRRIYDGRLDKTVGAQKKTLTWQGKITAIAAITDEGERHWGVMRSLGERFHALRPRFSKSGRVTYLENRMNASRLAVKQLSELRNIKAEVSRLTASLLDFDSLKPLMELIDPDDYGLTHLAESVAVLRAHVERNFQKQIVYAAEPEFATRILASMVHLARSHATLFRKDRVDSEDIAVARRMAFDSIPPMRCQIIKTMKAAFDKGDVCRWAHIADTVRISASSLDWALDEMSALNILKVEDGNEKTVIFTTEFQQLVDAGWKQQTVKAETDNVVQFPVGVQA